MKNTNQHDRNDPHKVIKLAEEECDQMDTLLAKYSQNSDECQAETVRWTLSGWIGHCPIGGLYKLKLQVGYCSCQVRYCPVRLNIIHWEVSKNANFYQIFPLSSQV
jgi:hypothetical protein